MENVYSPQQAELVSYGVPVYDDTPREYVEAPPTEQANEVVVTPTEVPVVETHPPAEVVPSDAAKEEESLSDQERIFKEMFEKTFGMPPEELRGEIEATRQEKQRLEAERQLSQLQKDWDVDEVTLSERLSLINERLGKLPEAARQALDNYEGINLIWNAIRAEAPQGVTLPRYEKNSVAGGANTQRPLFTREELAKMPADEYRRRNDEILYAYQNNLIA